MTTDFEEYSPIQNEDGREVTIFIFDEDYSRFRNIKDYRWSPIPGKTLTLSVDNDTADKLEKIGSKPVTIQIKTIDSENGDKYTIEYYNFVDGMVLADSGTCGESKGRSKDDLRAAKSELERFRHKYKMLKALAPVFAAIEELEKTT